MPDDNPIWEVQAGCPACEVVRYFGTPDEVLDFCGKLLYGNPLFEVLLLTIRCMEKANRSLLGDEFSSNLSQGTEWVMRIAGPGGTFRERQMSSRHELLGMLLAELRTGHTVIDVRHISNTCEPLSEA